MNKFIVRLPGGNQAKKDVSKPKQTNNPKCQSTQAYLDLGQKSLGTTKKCVLCSMFYVIDDEDDVRSHTEFCRKVFVCHWNDLFHYTNNMYDYVRLQANKAPTIPTLTGHSVVSDFGDCGEAILRVKLGQSPHTAIIEQIVKLAIVELGSTEDLVCLAKTIPLCHIFQWCILQYIRVYSIV